MKRLIICWINILLLGVTLNAAEDSKSTPKLTDPLATAETKALYRNLHELADEGVLDMRLGSSPSGRSHSPPYSFSNPPLAGQ